MAGAIILAGLLIVARWNGRTIPRRDARGRRALDGDLRRPEAREHRAAPSGRVAHGGLRRHHARPPRRRPAPGGATVNATVAFGGIDMLVPSGWRISVRSTPIFGGLDDKTDHTVAPADDAPVLHIDAVFVFGGVDIKHQK